ncbi:MAG TPA: TonB-dependent receptor [Clostridia bacterium]|nr:TonB-dependent receptor [Clostridia bacterium]
MRSLVVLVLLCAAALAQQPTTVPTHEEEVVVTGTYDAVPLEETDRAVSTISVGENPVLFRDWVDVLQQDPSLDIRQRAPGVQADLSIRGSSFGQTLVLLNGLRVNDAQSAHHNLDLPFPFAELERVEVLRGSGSTLYGSDALGGAVNFITAVPEHHELRLGAAAGNFGTNQQSGRAAFGFRRWSQSVSFTRELSTGFMPDRDYRNLALASTSAVRSKLGVSRLLFGYSDRPFGADQFYGRFNSWERTKGWMVAASQQLGSRTQVAFGYRRHTDIFVLYRDRPAVYKNDHLSESYQAAVRRSEPLSRNTRLHYGAEFYRDNIDSSNLGSHVRDRGAVYAAFDARALKRFSLTVGAREEFFTGGARKFSPSVSGGYWLSERIKLRASASHAFRLPTYTDLYYRDPANVGDPDLRPESAWSYDLGAQFTLSNHVAADVTVFHRRERDVIDYVRSSPANQWQARNFQRLDFTGVETAVRWQFGSHILALAYTGLTGAQESLDGVQSKYVFNYPVHSGSATWTGRMPFRMDGRARIGTLKRFERDAYPLLEFMATRQFGNVRPFVQFTNVTNTGYEEIPGVRMPGRAVLVGVEVVFGKRSN